MDRAADKIKQGSAIAKAHCAIALGSNLGESKNILEEAIKQIQSNPEIELLKTSSFYKTKPIGPPQPDYLNGCIIIQTTIEPEELLNLLLKIEKKFGRQRTEKWGARTLDLDIIFYHNLIIDIHHLQIPHPLMRQRPFVLVPLIEIAPQWQDPLTGLTITQLHNKLAYNPDDIRKIS